MTKEELVGRKVKAGSTIYTLIEEDGKLGLVSDKMSPFFGLSFSPYTVEDWNRYIIEGSWKLIDEDPKMYKTPKGIEYGVGTQYSFDDRLNGLGKVLEINDNKVIVELHSGRGNRPIGKREFESTLDTGLRKIVNQPMKDYKQVDPKTIKFDFTNTKIKVNNAEESKWIYAVGKVNNYSALSIEHSNARNLFFWLDGNSRFIAEGHNEDFNRSNFKEITIQDILNMQKIEVGDVCSHGLDEHATYTITKLKDNGVGCLAIKSTGSREGSYLLSYMKIISKGSKQEIIGYETVVDLPGIPKGSKSTGYGEFGAQFIHNHKSYGYNPDQLVDTKFFKPIYKAKEVLVEISKGRKVKIDGDKKVINLGDGEGMSFQQLQGFCENYIQDKHVSTKVKMYNFQILTFKIGCQEFTKEDIQKVYQAIQNN